MLPTETDTIVDNYTNSGMIDQLIDNECFCTNYNQNSQPMTSTEFANKTISNKNAFTSVTKSYELNNDVIAESYFDITAMENKDEFVNDYVSNYPNGIILVLNEIGIKDSLVASMLESKLKHVIVCNDEKTPAVNNSENKVVMNMQNAAKVAFDMAEDGQVILFHGVSSNFDLFSHIY